MTDYTISTTIERPFDDVIESVREALGEAGFGILTEIDLANTLKEKVGADLPPQVILGACQPSLAHEAVLADPSVAALLPCNVVVRATGDSSTVVEAFDPDAMVTLAGADADSVRSVADDARQRLTTALDGLA